MPRQEIDLDMTIPRDERADYDSASEIVHDAINILVQHCHARSYNAGWWLDPLSNMSLIPNENVGSIVGPDTDAFRDMFFPYVLATKISLIHSEVSEMLEAIRTDATDDKLTDFKGVTAEAADVVIRVCDLIGMLTMLSGYAFEYSLANAILAKIRFNGSRADHTIAARVQPNGKKF